jgi:hypothetical protein
MSDASNAVNLFLPLKSPTRRPALLQVLQEKAGDGQAALEALHDIHDAHFRPSSDGSILLVITEFNGDLESCLMDAMALLGDIFTAILEFVHDALRLSVQAYPRDFCDVIQQHDNAAAKACASHCSPGLQPSQFQPLIMRMYKETCWADVTQDGLAIAAYASVTRKACVVQAGRIFAVDFAMAPNTKATRMELSVGCLES